MRSWQRIQKGNQEDDKWTSAWLFNVIMGKHADAIAAYPAPAIRPREPDDREEAAKLSSVLPVILEQNDFEEVYSDSQWTKLKQGTLIWHVKWDSSKLNGLGDISVQPVDILSFFWEPGVRDLQKSKNIFLTEMVDVPFLQSVYDCLCNGKDFFQRRNDQRKLLYRPQHPEMRATQTSKL